MASIAVYENNTKSIFGTEIELQENQFCWLGSSKPLDAFKYFFRMTDHGPIVAHCYQYEPGRSTWVIEMGPDTWTKHGFSEMAETDYVHVLEQLFAEHLQGHALIANRSIWRRFPTIRNRCWVKDNLVLIGDAKATAHYSIGSGTKLAMEDAIALLEALRQHDTLDRALSAFETQRRPEVEKTQHAADVSLAWFENMHRYWGMAPTQFAFGVMSRSKQVTYDNLRLRDPSYIDQVNHWFVEQVRQQHFTIAEHTPPMLTSFRLRDLVFENRTVVSPMAQYSAQEGVPQRLAFGPLRQPRYRWCRLAVYRDDLHFGGCSHHSGLYRVMERCAVRGLGAYCRLCTSPQPQQDLHAARSCRPQRFYAAGLGSDG